MKFIQHPIGQAFPAMCADDFQALKDDIKAHGQREPIMLFEGMVLDGWHRYRACVDLDIRSKQFTFTDGDPVALAKSENLHRRHLTASQRAASVVALAAWVPANIGRPGKARDATIAPLPEKGATIAPLLQPVATKAEMAKEAKVRAKKYSSDGGQTGDRP